MSQLAGAAPGLSFRPSRLGLAVDRLLRWAVAAVVVAGVAYLLAPLVSVVGTSLNHYPSVRFPPESITLQSYRDINPGLIDSFLTSLKLAAAATLAGTLIAVPAALALARGRLRGWGIVTETVLRSPLQMPELVIGVAIFQFYSLLYTLLTLPLRGTFTGLLIAHVLLVTPYMLVALHGRLVAQGTRLEEAAAGLGAGPLRTFFAVTLPLLRPALVAAGTLSFLVSFDNVPISLFLAGPGASPFPVALFDVSETSVSPTIYAAATVALAISIVATLVVERFVGLRTVLSR